MRVTNSIWLIYLKRIMLLYTSRSTFLVHIVEYSVYIANSRPGPLQKSIQVVIILIRISKMNIFYFVK